jgi:hypothetical protein
VSAGASAIEVWVIPVDEAEPLARAALQLMERTDMRSER